MLMTKTCKYNRTIKLLGIVTATLLLVPIASQTSVRIAMAQENSSTTGVQLGPSILEQTFTNIEKSLPGFGGAFLDDQGRLNVYLKEPLNVDPVHVSNVIAQNLGPDYLENGVVLLEGKHEWNKWISWRQTIRELFQQRELGISMLDIDEKQQMLTIGLKVLNQANKDKITQVLSRLSVPVNVVLFEEVGPVVLESDGVTVRPLKGGMQLGYGDPNPTVNYCTATFVANKVSNGQRVLVTNGHCEYPSPDPAGDNSYRNPANGSVVGTEIVNTNPTTSRWSDSLLFAPSVDSQRGKIYRDAFTEFTIQAKGYNQVQGEFVYKMGAKTHETGSTISATCVDTPHPYGTLWCQNLSKYTSDSGDSGSPVYKKGTFPNVTLYGIHWGKVTVSGTIYTAYSPIWNIEQDQGTLTVTP